MRSIPFCAFICTCLILFGCVSAGATDPAQYDKSIRIHMTIDNGKITTTATEIAYGSAPNHFPIQAGFTGQLVATDTTILKTFPVWDPRVQIGDSIVMTPDGSHLMGVVGRRDVAEFVVVFPFDPEISGFRLYDYPNGDILASVDLQPHISEFFTSYPLDPDNPALSGSGALAITDPEGTGTPDPDTTASDQIAGLGAIGAGAVLLLGGAFASVRFLRKKPLNVLIVDDNRDIIVVIAGMLKVGGYIPRSATSGAECFKEIDSAVPDLILLDIGMEPMDGWEILGRIKKNPATKQIPVIMLTAQKLTPKDVLDYGSYIEDYIVKPVTSQGLANAIMQVFARKQLIDEKIAAAKEAGITKDELCECARLTRVVDVNKRLWDLLVSTYQKEEWMMEGTENEMTRAIRNIEGTFRNQEMRLHQIHRNVRQNMQS